MTRAKFTAVLCRVCLRTLLLTLATFAASAASPKRVLVLNPYGREVAPVTTVISSFRSTLSRELGAPVDIYELPLELERFAEPDGASSLATFLEGRIKEQSFDIVVPVASAGMQFAAKHRERLFPNTPILVLGAEPRLASRELLGPNATIVAQRADLPGMVEDILQIQPQTTNIVVIFGGSALERFWTEQCRREFQVFTNRVRFTWVNDLPLSQILKLCATLPPKSFVLHAIFFADAAGVPCERNEALLRLHEVANAPLFSYYASELGLGSIGGRLYRDYEVGAQGGRTAIRILRGEKPGDIPPQILETRLPTYDWRELRRWSISEARLPAGSVVQFRQPSFWERYRWPIAGTVMLCLLQAALIVGLLVNRSKRKLGEAEAALIADISSKFVNLPPTEVDREIVEAQRRICQFLDLDLSVLWQVQEVNADFIATHAYQREASSAPSPPFRQEDFPWVRSQVTAGRMVIFTKVAEMPAEAVKDKESASRFEIKSTLTIPLLVGGEPIGVLSFNALRKEVSWPDALVKRLQLAAQIFANALARKRADHALRESAERLNLAADSAEAGLWVLDCRTLEIWTTEKARALFGYLRDKEITLSQFKESVHIEDWALVQESMDRARQAGEPINMEYRIRLGDGRERWIASRGRAFSTSNGKPERLQGLSMDITERKRTEDQVRQLSLAVEQSPVSVLITDLQGNIIYVNRKFSEVSGYSLEECVGRNSRILKSGETPAATYEAMWAGITHGRTWRGEIQNRKKNGELYWEWEVLSPLLDAAGQITHFVGVKEDITERKRAEEALLKSFAEIECLKDRLQAESDYLKAEVKVTQTHGEIIGRSAGIRKVLSQAEQVAPTDSTVLISGETGTGKELIAETIHRLSPRGSRVMVKVNCAALPASLVESELFGREKGAYTGALMRQIGRFELADNSTIFLDEVGELSLDVQAKLLRVLQEGQFERLGSPRTIKVNVRLIGATNRDLREEVRNGRFREDLYYRLNVFPIRVPPLRDRAEDVPLLVWSFLEKFSSRMGRNITQVSRKTMEILQRHAWPGNVRELRNVIEHSTIITTGETLKVPLLEQSNPLAQPVQTMEDCDREHIIEALEKTGWRIKGPKGTATLLGLNPSTLYGRMRKLGIVNRRHEDQPVEDLSGTRH